MADEELNVENEILSNIGEDDAPSSEDNNAEANNEEAAQISTEGEDASNNTAASPSDGGNTETRQANSPQDLLGPNGEVLAKGGAERRLYENMQRTKRELDNTTTNLANANAKLEAYESASNLGTQYSLTPEELGTGAQIMAAYKTNPVETVKHLLTQAQAAGHNVDGIVEGGTNHEALKQMIADAVAPLTNQVQQEQEANTKRERAQKIYNDFVSQNPDAELHSESLTRLLQDNSNLTLDAAYFKLKTLYLERGLDWSKPLAVLQEEAKAAQAQAPNTAQQSTIPSGGNVNSTGMNDADEVADVNASMDDIIKSSMKDAGIM